jgi:predicted acylesterase/phospholipase RssA
MPDAIVLSGGGSKGAFEVGVLLRLYEDPGFRPDIICGASAGALNAVKMAEDPHNPQQVVKLRALWEGLQSEADMYTPQPWFASLPDDLQDVLTQGLRLKGMLSQPLWNYAIPGFLASTVITGIISLIELNLDLYKIGQALDKGKDASSIYSLQPISNLLTADLNEKTIQSTPDSIKLLLAVTNFSSGDLRYVNKHGEILDRNLVKIAGLATVSLHDAALASSSVPIAFPPVSLAGQLYVDGGVRANLPVQAALRLGASRVFAIMLSPHPGVTVPDAGATIAVIGTRTVDILMEEMIYSELASGSGQQIIVIAPLEELHSLLLVDPGVVRIDITYGYMRAADVMAGSSLSQEAVQLASKITQLRYQIYQTEDGAAGAGASMAGALAARSMKKNLYDLVTRRQKLGGVVPAGCENWWRNWEYHSWKPAFPTPWNAHDFVGGGHMEAQPAPDGWTPPSPPTGNNATFVSQSLATTMTPGQHSSVTVTMRNTGTQPWTPTGAHPYYLGSQNPGDNLTWGTRQGTIVNTGPNTGQPSTDVVFVLSIVAPTTPGQYNWQWMMKQDGVEWFGNPTPNVVVTVTAPPPPPRNGAAFVSQSLATTMIAAEHYSVTVTMRNTGGLPWTSSGAHPYYLGSQNPGDNLTWGSRRVDLPATVQPNTQVAFHFDIIAPSKPGQYNWQWMMKQDGVEWFGTATPNVVVTVTPPGPVNPECAQIRTDIATKKAEVQSLEEEKQTADKTDLPRIDAAIRALNLEITQLQARATTLKCP